jgi:hypothetical protein
MVTQGLLPFKYEIDKAKTQLTGLGGLPLFMEFFNVVGMRDAIRRHMRVRERQGYSDVEILRSLVMMQLAGGENVEDIKKLNGDVGFSAFSKQMEDRELSRRKRKQIYKRFRKGREQTYPSPSAVFRYLSAFHSESQETTRKMVAEREGKAFIPEMNAHLRSLRRVNRDTLAAMNRRSPKHEATLDMDATLVETRKGEAQRCYKHYKAYQPMMTWWWEQGVIVHTEFRDGNVPAGYDQLRILRESLDVLPKEVKTVRLRSDTAGYQHKLMEFCVHQKKRDKPYRRFGPIEFSISCSVSKEFRQAVKEIPESEWKQLRKERDGIVDECKAQWAEVCYVPNKSARHKKGMPYRYIAIREPLRQLALPGVEIPSTVREKLHVEDMGGVAYKVFGLVTNMYDWDGEKLIKWHHKRCGKSEEAHGILKNDLAGGTLPSGKFGENAAWWWTVVLAFNLLAIMKHTVLPERFRNSRLKAVRYWLINIPGRLLRHARRLIIRLSFNSAANRFIMETRQRIARWAQEEYG